MADGEVLERLVVQFDADINKLTDKLNKVIRSNHAAAKEVETAWGNVNVGESLKKVFDSSRFAVMEEGASKLRIFGSALEPLGPLGLAAAAGIAAVGFALEEAHKAAEFADKIEDTAKKLHVTTDALQEYRYAVFQAGGTQEGADQALEAFSVTLGKAQEGLTKAQRAFLALGFTKEEINSFKDVDSALKAVTERINDLKNNPQRDALIDQLGLTGMKPLILEGVDAMERLRKQAEDIGVVMDADLVKKGAEANKQFETLEQVVSVQLKSAFVELAPVLVDILKTAAALAREIADVVESLQKIENRSRGQLQRSIDEIDAGIARDSDTMAAHPNDRLFAAAANARIRRAFEEREKLSTQLDKLGPADDTPGVPSGNRALVDQGRHGGGSKYDIVKASLDAIAQAAQAEARARLALSASVEEQLAIETEVVNVETKKKIDDLKRQAADKKITAAAEKRAIDLVNQERDERIALLTRQATWKLEDQEEQVHRALLDAQLAQLQLEADQATTIGERNKIEREILRLKHLEAYHLQGKDLSRQVESGQLTQEQADAILAAGNATRSADTQSVIYKQWYSPVHDAITAAVKGGWPGLAQYMADRLKTRLIDALTDSVVQSLLSGGSSPFGSFIASGLHFLGFADGTNSAPGGLSIVGERGPELMNVPRGAQIIPAHTTAAILSGHGSGGGTAIALTVNVSAEGAVVADQVRAMVHQGVSQAIPAAVKLATVKVKTDLHRAAYNQIR